MISLIVAKARNNAIGRGNKMPWHISGDLKYFKQVTYGHPVVMGYNTLAFAWGETFTGQGKYRGERPSYGYGRLWRGVLCFFR